MEGFTNRGILLMLVLAFSLGIAAMLYRHREGFLYNTKSAEKAHGGMHGQGDPGVVTASVGNRDNIDIAWNSTPTDGMFSNTTAPAVSPLPPTTYDEKDLGGGLSDPVEKCSVPTGFLAAMVNAWSEGKREGIVSQDGIPFLDMGIDGAWYDAYGLGCCDTYCRKVTKGGYWSCIDPQIVGTQYKAGKPRGIKCTGMNYGQRIPASF